MIPLDGFAGRAAAHRRRTGRPLVTLTYAQSLDGSIAARRDQRLKLSGEGSQHMTHELRAAHAAILVGIGTALADDPRLTARLSSGPNPQPVILDSRLRIPLGARLFDHPDRQPWIFASERASAARQRAVEGCGGRVIRVSALTGGRLDLLAVLETLAVEGMDSLMVEGGARVITSFLAGALADWLVITIAPVFVGGVRALEGGDVSALPSLLNPSSAQIGEDVIIWGDLKAGPP